MAEENLRGGCAPKYVSRMGGWEERGKVVIIGMIAPAI